MSNFVRHEPCPKCRSRDNLARYDDGHSYCFGCGFYEHANKISRPVLKELEPPPPDLVRIPENANRDWLRRYLSDREIDDWFLWSPYFERHVYLYAENGVVTFWEARSVTSVNRVFSYGKKPLRVIRPQGKHYANLLVIVEDIVSAIKVSRVWNALPLHGSFLPLDSMATLKKEFQIMVFWLDSDKLTQSMNLAKKGTHLGVTTYVVHTEQDPKAIEDPGETVFGATGITVLDKSKKP